MAEKKFQFPPLGDLHVPPLQKFKLSSGVNIYFLEDHQLPLVRFYVMTPGGSALDPAGQVGLAALGMELVRTGGVPGLSGDQLDELLDNLGAEITTGIEETALWISASCLAKDTARIADLIAAMLREPKLSREKLDLAKVQFASKISRRNDEPSKIANREFEKLVYGKSCPFAYQTEYTHLKAISRKDIAAWSARFFRPADVTVGLWGDFNPSQAHDWLEAAFAQWESRPGNPLDYPQPVGLDNTGIYLVPKKDINQSFIRIGHLGTRMDTMDFPAVEALNNIFGSGRFMSRLMKIIRTEKGLTYSIQGKIGAREVFPGVFSVSTFTKSESTVEAINAIGAEIRRIREELVSDVELASAQEAFLNSFVFKFESTFRVLTRKITLNFYSYPEDFMEQLRDRYAGVTSVEVLRAAQAYLHPDRLITLVVGDPGKITPALATLGPVQEVDITIPPPARKKRSRSSNQIS